VSTKDDLLAAQAALVNAIAEGLVVDAGLDKLDADLVGERVALEQVNGALTRAQAQVVLLEAEVATTRADMARTAGALQEAADLVQRALQQLAEDPEPGPDPEPDPEPGLKALVWGPVIPAEGLPANRGQFHHLFYKGFDGAPWRAWDSKAGYDRNAAEWRSRDGGLQVRMDPSHGPDSTRAGSSESHEGWLYFDRRYQRARMEIELLLIEPFVWPKTAKAIGGLVGWNGSWPEWPGGGAYGPDNASVRLILNDYNHNGRARLGAYVYLGRPFLESEVQGFPRPNYISNANRSVEFLLDAAGTPPAGRWIALAVEAWTGENGRGGLSVEVDGETRLSVTNLPWFSPETPETGWTTGSPCGIFGGNSADYNPAGGSRSLAYRNLFYSGGTL
jgi:hypothetical protein